MARFTQLSVISGQQESGLAPSKGEEVIFLPNKYKDDLFCYNDK